jgi:hypothetical protein
VFPIPLQPIPGQSVSFNVDNAFWQLKFYQSVNFMCCDITVNGTAVMNGVRCFGGFPLLPYGYMSTPGYGNLIFDSDGDWTKFGTSCNLYYLEAAEYQQFELMMLLGVSAKTN